VLHCNQAAMRAPLANLVLTAQNGVMKKYTFLSCARLGSLALLLGLGACSGVAASGDSPPPARPAAPVAPQAPAPSQAMWQKIQEEIGDAACDNAGQCRTLPVGHKACGGPEGYVAYSTKNTDAAKLAQLAADHAAARKGENERSGMASNCMMERDPGATCSAGRCVLLKGGAGVSAQ
jgi:hypothetical protein